MFKRRWIWFGKLISDEGFHLSYCHKSINYSDNRGTFQFGLEDGLLFPTPFQISGERIQLTQLEINQIIERIIRGIRSEGHDVQVDSK
jgi:hypothetical protein